MNRVAPSGAAGLEEVIRRLRPKTVRPRERGLEVAQVEVGERRELVDDDVRSRSVHGVGDGLTVEGIGERDVRAERAHDLGGAVRSRHAGHLVAGAHEHGHELAADRAARSGDEDPHREHLRGLVSSSRRDGAAVCDTGRMSTAELVTDAAALRPLLFSIAYRMLGSVGDAEDVVQESFVRYQRALDEGADVGSPKGYLSAVVTRLAIDELRSARHRREMYVGTWFPEPLLTGEDDAAAAAEMADTISMAFLLLLETLSPVERAVFVLHDVFAYGYREVASIIDKTEANTRQIAARARARVAEGRPRFEGSRTKRDELANAFLAAVRDGDIERLERLLTSDVSAAGDGGGKAPAVAHPVEGVALVARFLIGIWRQAERLGVSVVPAEANGCPAFVGIGPDGEVVNVLVLEIAPGGIRAVRSVLNPDKLRHVRPPR
jgi:RNA polymerase sigma-70 factor (ECF subfamily)